MSEGATGAAAAAMGGEGGGAGGDQGTGDAGTQQQGAAAAAAAEAGKLPEWATGASDEQAAKIRDKGWKSPLDAVTGYMGAEGLRGADPDRIRIMPKDADDMEGLKAWRDSMGIPETPDGYNFDDFEIGDGDDDLRPVLRTAAHRWGLDETTAKGIATDLLAGVNEVEAAKTKAWNENSQKEYREQIVEWGGSADANIQRITQFCERMDVDFAEAELFFGTKKWLTQGLAMALATSEHRVGDDGPGTPPGPGTPESQANAKITRMSNDKDFIARLRNNEPQAMAEWTSAHEEAYGTEVIGAESL